MPYFLRNLILLLIHLHFFFQPFHITHQSTQASQAHVTPTVVDLSVTVSPTVTYAPTPTDTLSPTEIPTPTVNPTDSPTPTITPTDVLSPTPTDTPTPSAIITPTDTPKPTEVPTDTPTPSESLTPSPTSTPSATPTPTEPIGSLGNDISYPQCGLAYPSGQTFGIVGVNGGISTTSNPCLSSELLWASLSNGATTQQKVQLYVNTANPGGLNTASWPKNNTDPAGIVTTNPYGICDGSDSLACAWQYGWNRAVEDVINRFMPAAQTAGISDDPAAYSWWLDVETVNTWKSGSDFAYQSNAADLEGMVAYLQAKGVLVGIYSTSHQWGETVSSISQTSNLNGLRNWLPGATDLASAKLNCALSTLTTGGKVILTQYTAGNFDYDYSCE